uniref:Reverse transcriptase n=1 Tax=Cacopsylla melanoneura TaxID=428564 RepID=A0A8D8ZM48_9HEMI
MKLGRLKSRHPPVETAIALQTSDSTSSTRWRESWDQAAQNGGNLLPCIETFPPGFDLPRRTWVSLNRARTNCGRCADMFHKWGIQVSSACDCGAEKQTVHHIILECPLRKFTGSLEDFMTGREEAIEYLNNLDIQI